MQVRVHRLSGFLGRGVPTAQVGSVRVVHGAVYDVSVINGQHHLVDDDGNTVYMRVKAYQAQNRCEFYIMDTSYANEAHADLVVVGGQYDECDQSGG